MARGGTKMVLGDVGDGKLLLGGVGCGYQEAVVGWRLSLCMGWRLMLG